MTQGTLAQLNTHRARLLDHLKNTAAIGKLEDQKHQHDLAWIRELENGYRQASKDPALQPAQEEAPSKASGNLKKLVPAARHHPYRRKGAPSPPAQA